MIPRSTTLGVEGRTIRIRIVWGAAVALTLAVLALAFTLLDRSRVVDGPSGSTHVTTATGLAALHDTLAAVDRDPLRLGRPIDPAALEPATTYLVSDVDFGSFEQSELEALASFVESGRGAVVLGLPPRRLLDAFQIEIDWKGATAGAVATDVGVPDVSAVAGTRFGLFEKGHGAEVLAAAADGDLAVRVRRGRGSVILVADSSIAHNATIDLADNIDFLGILLPGRTIFDEYRHGFDDRPAAGWVDRAPGNWSGALWIGAAALAVTLASYGRRFGPPEPSGRALAPDRGLFLDSVSRSLRRARGALPVEPLRTAVLRELGLPPDAGSGAVAERAAQHELDPGLAELIDHDDRAAAFALDEALATLTSRRRSR